MRIVRVSAVVLLGMLLLPACAGARRTDEAGRSGMSPPAPRAEARPVELEKHGDVRVDPYFWLNQREDPDVLAYLEAENAYLDRVLGHTEQLQQELFDEIVGRIKEDDSSVPEKLDDYYYYVRYREGGEYPLYCRKKGSLEADEEVMLDVNELAEGHEYYAVRNATVSASHDILAFGVDTVGRRRYTIRFRDLATGRFLDDEIPEVTSNFAWAEDNRTLFYSKQHPETLRWEWIYRHRLGTDAARDALVYHERDDTFDTFVFKAKSRRYLLIGSDQTLTNEYRYLPADDPEGEWRVIQPRERGLEYAVDHYGDHFYLRTNLDAKNFRLVRTPVDATTRDNWVDVIPHDPQVLLENFEIFKDFLVVDSRKDGLTQLRVRPWSGGEHLIDFGEPAYTAYIDEQSEFDTAVLRFGYSSMTTPRSIFDYDMRTREKTLRKQDEVLGDFDPADYVTERLSAPARDGKQVPISLVYRKGFRRNGSHPVLLYGYGSYGASMEAGFSSTRLSLIDRGFVYAIAHIRGGEELGREWYEDGKLFNKKNTFTDFIDCGEHLIREKYADPDRLFAYGGSAGGLLIGAVVNMRPDLWRGAVAAVPFVDVVTTMLDDSIPLTTSEYDEWGNPNEKAAYEYIKSYSPYDNVEAQDYPNLLVTTGLHDSQVQYWEPAKWVAKLRARKTGDNLLLLHTNMEAGHGGTTGRFKRHRRTALNYAFLLELAR